MSDTIPEPVRHPDEIRLLDLMTALLLHWRLVVGFPLVTMMLGVLLFLAFSGSYTAETVILPNEEKEGFGAQIAALTENLPLDLDLMGGTSRNVEVIEAILESRSLADSVIARLDLKSRWEATDAGAREILTDRVELTTEEAGAITIEVRGDDPELAARIANAYPVELNSISARLNTEFADRRGRFLEAQLARARGRLEEAEARLVEFQEGHTTPQVEEQARQTIRAAAELQLLVIEKELELAGLSRFATADNPRYREAASQLAALRSQLRELTGGRGSTEDIFVSLREAPELGMSFGRLFRELTEKEQIHLLLTAGLAQAQIDAARDLPIVGVLDPAIPPEQPSGPPLLLLVLLTGTLGLVLGVLAAFAAEAAGQLGAGEDARFRAAWTRARREWRYLIGGRPA